MLYSHALHIDDSINLKLAAAWSQYLPLGTAGVVLPRKEEDPSWHGSYSFVVSPAGVSPVPITPHRWDSLSCQQTQLCCSCTSMSEPSEHSRPWLDGPGMVSGVLPLLVSSVPRAMSPLPAQILWQLPSCICRFMWLSFCTEYLLVLSLI